jgi:hypothetical protein
VGLQAVSTGQLWPDAARRQKMARSFGHGNFVLDASQRGQELLSTEAEESAALGAVATKPLVKTEAEKTQCVL